MTTFIGGNPIIKFFNFAVILMLLFTQASQAQEFDQQKYDELVVQKKRPMIAIGERAMRSLYNIQELIREEKYAEALVEANKLNPQRINALELMSLNLQLATIYTRQEKYDEALNIYMQNLNSSALDVNQYIYHLYIIANLYVLAEDYPNALKYLNDSLNYQKSPSFRIFRIAAETHLALKQFDSALSYIDKAIVDYEEMINGYTEEQKLSNQGSIDNSLNILNKLRDDILSKKKSE